MTRSLLSLAIFYVADPRDGGGDEEGGDFSPLPPSSSFLVRLSSRNLSAFIG